MDSQLLRTPPYHRQGDISPSHDGDTQWVFVKLGMQWDYVATCLKMEHIYFGFQSHGGTQEWLVSVNGKIPIENG